MSSPTLRTLDHLVSVSGLPAVREVTSSPDDGHGLDNVLTVAQLEDGRRVVLRQSRVEQRSPRVRVEFLRGNGVDVPTLYGSDEEGSSLWEYVEGRPLGVMVESGRATDTAWANVGVALRRIHRVMFPSPLQGEIGVDSLTLRPVDPVDALHARLDDSVGWTRRQLPELERSLETVRRFLAARADDIRAERSALGHGDVNLLNIIVTPDQNAQFIDWDFPVVRYPMDELSALDEHAYLHGMDGLPPSFFEGYGAKVPSDLLLAHRIVGCVGWLSSDEWEKWKVDPDVHPAARARLRSWHERLMAWAQSIPSRVSALN